MPVRRARDDGPDHPEVLARSRERCCAGRGGGPLLHGQEEPSVGLWVVEQRVPGQAAPGEGRSRRPLVAEGAAEAEVGGLQRGGNALAEELLSARQRRHVVQPQHRGLARGAAHLYEVAQEPEACDVGAGPRPVLGHDLCGRLVRAQHRAQGGGDGGPHGPLLHLRREDAAGAQRLGQQERVPWLKAALRQELLGPSGHPRDAEAESSLGPLCGVAPCEGAA
mmetsp:Transcript_75697/g.233730  ORF Transcript_75697/g.233730 Transcript_75697/m.233730 type:complete len:222 (-) Transcript_75697:1963-2628(-)